MERHVKLYEEFDAAEAKAKLVEMSKRIKNRIKKRKESIKKSSEKDDALGTEINSTKLEIDQLDFQKVKLKNEVVDLRIKEGKNKKKSLAKRLADKIKTKR